MVNDLKKSKNQSLTLSLYYYFLILNFIFRIFVGRKKHCKVINSTTIKNPCKSRDFSPKYIRNKDQFNYMLNYTQISKNEIAKYQKIFTKMNQISNLCHKNLISKQTDKYLFIAKEFKMLLK